MTTNAYTYICELGHVDPVPTMGTYSSCQQPVRVAGARGSVWDGRCGRAVARVPYDPVLESTYRIGGPDAVLVVVKDRAAAHQHPAG